MFLNSKHQSQVNAINDLKLIDFRQYTWKVTGGDPQFSFKNRRIFPLPPGYYKVIAMRGSGLSTLTEASIYINTGFGYSEEERVNIRFFPDEPTGFAAYCLFEKPVQDIRFDPAAGSFPEFGLQSIEFRQIEAEEWERRPSVIRAHGLESLDNGKPRVLMNLVRLLPASAGAGGAGRVCNALLTYLPEFVRLRAAIAPDYNELVARHPDVEFVIATADDNAQLGNHLDWCECYVDPLNALRPTYIPAKVPVLGWVLDLQHLHFPWLFTENEFKARLQEYAYVISRADLLVAISDFERQNFQKFYGVHHTRVVHLSGFMAEDSGLTPEEVSKLRRETADTRPYLIYPAVPWLHKNHEILIQAIALMRQRGVDVRVVMTNTSSGKHNRDRLLFLIESLGVADLVRLEEFLPERDLLRLFINSAGLVFPSLYEGFGIPLVDALKLGVPILASKSSAIPEICGQACAYFSNERNALAISADIERFWLDADRRSELIAAGYTQGAKFSSKKMAFDLSEAIAELIERKSQPLATSAFEGLPDARLPRARRLSVFVIYTAPLDDNNLDYLMSIDNINQYCMGIFGEEASVTMGIDIGLLANEKLRNVFVSAEKLVCFDGTKPNALTFVVQDFSRRYDDADYQLITTYPESEGAYRPDKLRAMVMALDLHPAAHYAIFDPGLKNVVLEPLPSEVEGVLNYDERRKSGYAVFDALVRRAGPLQDFHNGSVDFLSALSTRAAKLRVPDGV